MIAALDARCAPTLFEGNRLFAGLSSEVVTEIANDVELIHADSDDVIFNEGEAGDCLYLVVEGSVRISKMGRGGKQETLGFIQSGNFFGEMALIDGQPRSAQASAAGSTTLGRLDVATFEQILQNAPRGLHQNFLRTVVERLRGVNAHFITEVMRTERLSTVGTMANSIIHDLRNPIQALHMCATLIEQRCTDDSVKSFTGIMIKSVEHMTDMVQELLDFARGQSSLQIERTPVNAIVEEFHGQLTRLIPEPIHLVRDVRYCDDVSADGGRFVRVLMNLAKNSVEAMSRGGIMNFEVEQRDRTACFRISDTGGGIPAELLPRIFEPFVTHGKSKGTGLGMAIVKSVVDAHGGHISIRSIVGVGTTVEVTLPTLDPLL